MAVVILEEVNGSSEQQARCVLGLPNMFSSRRVYLVDDEGGSHVSLPRKIADHPWSVQTPD
jgi:hypothetical protein